MSKFQEKVDRPLSLLRRQMHRKVVRIAAAAILQISIWGAGCAKAERLFFPMFTNEQLIENLNQYAFAPFGSKTEGFLIKWKGGIRLGASKDGDIPPEITSFLSEELFALAKITHLNIQQKNDDANLLVVFTDNPQRDFPKYKSEMSKLYMDEISMAALYKNILDGELPCAGKIFVIPKKEIADYLFFVSTQGQDQLKIKACVLRELMRAFGLLHFEVPSPSAPTFAKDLERSRGTAHALLAFLYRDDIPPGLSRSEVMKMLDATKENRPN